jgi:hypothetical protein
VKRDFFAMIIVGAFAASILLAGFIYSARAVDYGPIVPYSISIYGLGHPITERACAGNGFLYDESSTVRGSGDISIKGSFHDHAVDSSGWMKGTGSINFESLRSMNKIGLMVDFTQKADLVFGGGQLKNRKSLKSPLFERGLGASVNERFDLSHVDKSETDMIRSINRFNNTMVYDTALAFEGIWDIKNMRGWSINMNRSEEFYSGSFQTQKKIEFSDSGEMGITPFQTFHNAYLGAPSILLQ